MSLNKQSVRKERGQEKNGNGCTLSFYNGFWIYLVLDHQKRTDEGYLAQPTFHKPS